MYGWNGCIFYKVQNNLQDIQILNCAAVCVVWNSDMIRICLSLASTTRSVDILDAYYVGVGEDD